MTSAMFIQPQELSNWQAALDSNHHIFSAMLPGASIGLLPKSEINSPQAKLVVWEARPGKMAAEFREFTGFRDVGVDLLFIADNEALATLYQAKVESFSQMRELLRTGNILFYVFKTKNELLELGFEEFLETLGLAFLGACR